MSSQATFIRDHHIVGRSSENDSDSTQPAPIFKEKSEVTNQATACWLPYAAVYSAAQELGYDEQQSAAYATSPDLFVAENPDWIFDDAEIAHSVRVHSIADLMDAHRWWSDQSRCQCGLPISDWVMWRSHVAPLIATGEFSGNTHTMCTTG